MSVLTAINHYVDVRLAGIPKAIIKLKYKKGNNLNKAIRANLSCVC